MHVPKQATQASKSDCIAFVAKATKQGNQDVKKLLKSSSEPNEDKNFSGERCLMFLDFNSEDTAIWIRDAVDAGIDHAIGSKATNYRVRAVLRGYLPSFRSVGANLKVMCV
jgi:hypothetical protein